MRATDRRAKEERHLIDVLQEGVAFPLDWAQLRDESAYFGTADEFINRVLASIE
jgi:hypothetical protein